MNKDYGADPVGDGTFKMIPSGDVVSYEERMRRLPPRKIDNSPRICGLTLNEIEKKQGGKLKRDL